MNKQKKKKKIDWPSLFMGFLSGILGATIGIMSTSSGNFLTNIILFLIAFFLQVMLHEGGHCLFGLLSGYQFVSYRVGNLMLLKENGKFKIKKFSLLGTAGQCLMAPPEMVDGKIPTKLYNLGGILVNALVALITLPLYAFTHVTFFLLLGLTGIFMLISNGLPLKSTVATDGYNVLSLDKDPLAVKCFYVQLKVYQENINGVRIKDLPAQWFELPEDADINNVLISPLLLLKVNYLMETEQFEEARALIEKLLQADNLNTIHELLAYNDLEYLEVLSPKQPIEVPKNIQKLIKQTSKNTLAIIRTNYAKASEEERPAILNLFEKVAKNYPDVTEIQYNRELMEKV